MPLTSDAKLQDSIDRVNAGDVSARNDLITLTCERLEQLAHAMLRNFRRVRRFEETDDVLQNAVIRLMKALETVQVGSVADVLRLSAKHIRWELLDLSRRYFGPEGAGANHDSFGPDSSSASTPSFAYDRPTTTLEPSQLASWTEFHERIERLPDEQKAVFDLLYYQDLQQVQAAQLLGVSVATIRRRWLTARLKVSDEWRVTRAGGG